MVLRNFNLRFYKFRYVSLKKLWVCVRRMQHRNLSFLLVFAALAGCGRSGPEVAPVHGRITLDGKPLAHASVNFVVEGKSVATSYTDQDGQYEMRYKRGVPGADWNEQGLDSGGCGCNPPTAVAGSIQHGEHIAKRGHFRSQRNQFRPDQG